MVNIFFWLILSTRSGGLAFELRTFGTDDRNHAPVPWAADETSEAIEARALWRNAKTPTLEFVHIHKCGGTTFNAVAPALLCAQRWQSNESSPCSRVGCLRGDLAEWSSKWSKCGGPCCVVRPEPANSLPALLKKMPIKPRFASDRAEFSAFVIPWAPRTTFKAAMVRRPFDRWMSDVMYSCRGDRPGDVLPQSVGKYLKMNTQVYSKVRRNRIAQGLVPSVVLETARAHNDPELILELGSYDRLRGRALGAAEHTLYSFAFLGLVEEYELSICLFARTFLTDKDAVCNSCCRQPKHDDARAQRRLPEVPRVNAAGGGGGKNGTRTDECNQRRAELDWGEADRDLFDLTNTPDLQVFIIATRIFRARVALAKRREWGSTPQECGCEFYT